jgi:hypothetical protein
MAGSRYAEIRPFRGTWSETHRFASQYSSTGAHGVTSQNNVALILPAVGTSSLVLKIPLAPIYRLLLATEEPQYSPRGCLLVQRTDAVSAGAVRDYTGPRTPTTHALAVASGERSPVIPLSQENDVTVIPSHPTRLTSPLATLLCFPD